MSRVSSFRPGVEQLESREVPSTSSFVTHLYQDVLGRQPDSSGYAYWTTNLDLGTVTQGQVSIQFETSTENRTNVINNFFVGILGRNPTATEVSDYLSLFQAGVGQDRIRGMFFGSQEFFTRFGQNATAFVTQLYSQILDRNATSNEVSFWVNVLNSTNGDRTLVANEFLSGPEYERFQVQTAYTVFLHRYPDLSGYNFWVTQRESGQPVEVMAVGFLASSEYFWRA